MWGLGASSAVQLSGSQSKLYDTREAFEVTDEEEWCGQTLGQWFRFGCFTEVFILLVWSQIRFISLEVKIPDQERQT